MTNDDFAIEVHRLPSLVPTHAHIAYLNEQITRQEWLLLCGLHAVSLVASSSDARDAVVRRDYFERGWQWSIHRCRQCGDLMALDSGRGYKEAVFCPVHGVWGRHAPGSADA